MNTCKKLALVTGMLAITGLMYGCGTEEPGLSVSGAVQQGPIAHAVVFLDLNNNGVLDAGEPSTTTALDGTYTLPLIPGQTIPTTAKIVVTYPVGSIDTVTKTRPTGVLYAALPAGIGTGNTAQNVTPFTTLIAASPASAAALTTKLQALGLADPNGLISSTTPAVIALAKSVETVIAASQSSVAAVTSNAALSTQVANDVAASLAAAIALPANSVATLQTPAGLATVLATAAATTIIAEPTVFTVATPTLASISGPLNAAVTTVATAIQTAAGGTLSSSGTVAETAVVTPANAATITGAVTTATISVATVTSNDVTPPVSNGVAPTVVVTNNNQTVSVPVSAISVTFSENVKISTVVAPGSITLSNGGSIPGTVTYDPTAFVATFTPSTALVAGVTYHLTINTTVTDLSGTALAAPVTLTFTTATSATTPTGSTGGSGGSGGTTSGTGISF